MKKIVTNQYKRIILFHLILNIVFAVFISLSSYYHIPLSSFKGRFMYFIHLCILQSTFAGVLYFLSLFRFVFRLIFSLLFVVLGVIAFWTYSINISMSSTLISAVFSTKTYIIKDLIGFQFVFFLILLIITIYIIQRFYNTIKPRKGILIFFPISCILFVLFFWFNNKRVGSFSSKLPYALFYSINEHLNIEGYNLSEVPKVSDTIHYNKIQVVFVLGESLRADHLSLNGYKRQTNPLLSRRAKVISFNNIETDKTNTALSVPCILTNQSDHLKSIDSIYSIFDVYNTMKIPTYWIGNQLLESSYRPIVDTNNDVFILDELKSYWSIGKKRDMDLLPKFKNAFSVNEYGLFTLHMIGSHWWYEDKYTNDFRKYKPVINSKYIPSLTKEQIINSYDNTILYLDAFLDQLIEVLESQNKPTILIYIADHGESLGENGRFLHSHTEALTKPGMITWYSNSFKELYPEKVTALINNQNNFYSTDIIYHSLIDLLDVDEIDYDRNLSIFKLQDKSN